MIKASLMIIDVRSLFWSYYYQLFSPTHFLFPGWWFQAQNMANMLASWLGTLICLAPKASWKALAFRGAKAPRVMMFWGPLMKTIDNDVNMMELDFKMMLKW